MWEVWDFFGLSYMYYARVRARNGQVIVFWPVNLTLTAENLTLIGLVELIFTDFVSRRLTAAPGSIASAMRKSVKISSTCPICVSKWDVRDEKPAHQSEVSTTILFHGVKQS